MKITDQCLRIIDKVKMIDRVLLIISIAGLFISCLITLAFGERTFTLDNEAISGFIWFSILGSIYICLLSTVALIISIFIYRSGKREIWPHFKREVFLTLGCVASLTILHFSILMTQ